MKDVMKSKVKRVNERQEKVVVDEDCYEAHTVVFADNLYSFGQRNDNSVSVRHMWLKLCCDVIFSTVVRLLIYSTLSVFHEYCLV